VFDPSASDISKGALKFSSKSATKPKIKKGKKNKGKKKKD
jgi:hypothetical protein